MLAAIFDNTVFNIAARIQCCDLIRLSSNLFQDIFVPEEIAKEVQEFPQGYEPFAEKRMLHYFISITPHSKGLQLCTTVDKIVLATLQTVEGVDKGEAEAMAQAAKRGIYLFFTDDERCIKVLGNLYPHISFVSTLFLISLLDIKGYLSDYPNTIKEYLAFKPLPKKTGKAFFRSQYIQALDYYNLAHNRKLIQQKTSFKMLGIEE